MSQVLLKNQFTGSLPDAPEGHTRLMVDETGEMVLIDENRVERTVLTDQSVPLSGTGAVVALPLVKNTGFSTTLAALMEGLSSSMSKDGKRISPATPEQGVIELGAGLWTLERTLAVELTGAVSRFALTFRGQGDGATIIYVPPTASAANFKGPDNIWRMLKLTADGSGKFERFRMENLEFVSYFTQNADGNTRLTDDCRLIDTDYLVRMQMNNVRTYARNFAANTTNQYGLYLRRAYYSNVEGFRFTSFPTANSGVALNNATSGVGYGGVGICIEECNSAQVLKLEATGVNVGAIFRKDAGSVINGFHMENLNRAFHFEQGSYSCQALNGYLEFHYFDNSMALQPRDQMAVATFSATTRDNLVTVANGTSLPRILLAIDRSRDQSNVVMASGQFFAKENRTVTIAAPAVSVSGVTTATNADKPYTSTDATSVEVSWPGSYNQGAYYIYTVDPRAGSVRIKTDIKRVSGDGMMVPLVMSAGLGGGNRIANGVLLDPLQRFAAGGSGGVWSVAATGNSYSSSNNGELTLKLTRPHYLQRGMRLQNTTTLGSLAASTNLYVRATPAEDTVVLGLASGTLSDPGAVTTGTLSISGASDMYDWLGQEDCTRNWLPIDRKMPISFNVIALSLNGSNIPVITLDRTVASAGITNNSKLMLWGFNDSRLDGVAYTAQTADIAGSTITLTALGAMASLDVTSAAVNGLDPVTPVYGKIGFTEIYVGLVGRTTGAAACVWRMTTPIVRPGV